MKLRNKNLLSAWIIIGAIAGVGCASTATDEPPAAPAFETEAQMAAVHDCEAVYSCCTRSCSDLRTASNAPTAQARECLAACRAGLGECYRDCE
jgi:hypothetical protein